MRAEHELLICIARKSLDECARDRLRNLAQQNIDWSYLHQIASSHGLLPLLSNHLLTVAREIVPQSIVEQLRADSLDNNQSNLYLLHELLRVLQLFTQNGIRALAFKGPILSKLLYGDVGLRRAGDLDILIAKEDFSRAKELLQSNSYLMEPQLTPAQMTSHLDSHCEIQFLHQDQFSVVDLHWGLTPKSFPFLLGFEDLWDRCTSISFGRRSIETFATEDLLLYLCVHGAKHYWTRLEWLASVAELVRSNPAIDWGLVVRQSRETRSERILCIGLLLVSDLFALELPLDVRELVNRTEGLRECVLGLEKKLLQETTAPPTQIEMFRLNLQLMDWRGDAVKGLLRSVLVPTISDWQALTLPTALYPVYYLYRPFRLLKKHSKS